MNYDLDTIQEILKERQNYEEDRNKWNKALDYDENYD